MNATKIKICFGRMSGNLLDLKNILCLINICIFNIRKQFEGYKVYDNTLGFIIVCSA